MHARPIPITCARCRKSLAAAPRSERRELRFDERTHDLCAECWAALDEWMNAGARVRANGAAA
ncbi:MAG TPA: hypothetical protein VHF22_07645 [Planctomycetota bacterium]|nr:hypothetical protein [Planctomycetota bacterium]